MAIGSTVASNRNGMVIKLVCRENEKLMLEFIFALNPLKPSSKPNPNSITVMTIVIRVIISAETGLPMKGFIIRASIPAIGTINKKIRFII
jgi:hypothetical protein